MKINELLEGRHNNNWTKDGVEMCSKDCCGEPVTECTCGPTCPHCDCYEKNKAMKETTTAGAIASNAGAGFANGGIGTLSRAGSIKKKRKKKSTN